MSYVGTGKTPGINHSDTAITYNNIAAIHYEQEEHEIALDWNFKALDIRKEQLGADHMVTASSYNNIAAIYQKQGD